MARIPGRSGNGTAPVVTASEASRVSAWEARLRKNGKVLWLIDLCGHARASPAE